MDETIYKLIQQRRDSNKKDGSPINERQAASQ
jgi:hypothetical protein